MPIIIKIPVLLFPVLNISGKKSKNKIESKKAPLKESKNLSPNRVLNLRIKAINEPSKTAKKGKKIILVTF